MKDPTQVHLITVLVIDHDKLGAKECASVLEHTRYSNDCIGPLPVGPPHTKTVDWSDDHPLNRGDTFHAELARLFPESAAVWTPRLREPESAAVWTPRLRELEGKEQELRNATIKIDELRAKLVDFASKTRALDEARTELESTRTAHRKVMKELSDTVIELERANASLKSTDRQLGECDTERCEALTLLEAARKLAKQREAGESDARESAALTARELAIAVRDLREFTSRVREALGMDEYKAPEQLVQRMRVITQAWELKPTTAELDAMLVSRVTSSVHGADDIVTSYLNRVMGIMNPRSTDNETR